MNKLYFVALYNHSRNEWARVCVSANSAESATEQAESNLAYGDKLWHRDWKAKVVREICSTPDEVWIEV